MHGIGTLINVGAILLGGFVGLFVKKGLNEKLMDSVMKAIGVAVMFVGISGALTGLLKITESGSIETSGTMLMIISLILGTFVGELLKIEDRLEGIGEKLKGAVRAKDSGNFVEGFVNTTLIFCVGAMAIIGSLEDGLTGDFTTLAAKSILDGIMALIIASTMGVGVLFSAIPVFLYQGAITLLAEFISPILSDSLVLNLSYIGSALIFGIGVNQVFGKKIKTGNMLPALLIPIIYELFTKLVLPLF
ncbi:MAG: DUF554 domain-containing protein [Oscillospiraceae bacterium]|nr:DUF554 domain-containing protein [Oscillospiraceae bacterium]